MRRRPREVDALPSGKEAASPQERAALVDEANEMLRAMVRDLRAAAPEAGADADADAAIVGEWFGDWDTYIGDRDDWADILRSGEDGRFFETAKGGGPISELIDKFADVNEMASCATPDDV